MEKIKNRVIHEGTHTLVYTDVVRDGATLVLTCGYSSSNTFGYFVCWERCTEKGTQYENEEYFFQKENEKTFQVALQQLHTMVKNIQNKTHA